jgi:Inner membrane protein YgaP-like, transmembrane domain
MSPHKLESNVSSTQGKNEHRIDRSVRVVLGLILLTIVFVGPRTPWGWIGLVPLVTGLIGTCPVYALFGLSTCPRDGGC